ncbi:hypothetical protein [Vibrio sp. qd031]|uniref:hypothetical protein n=1 Tax=Vibrio sp. qd031 TaxID=1603038 RepID=UPI000A10EA69|nr:hypothetical protein [Vibrio sp. qd031]
MKTIRSFHRVKNYTSKPSDRVMCEHSLAHSLRIAPPTAPKKTKRMEWNSKLASKNLIYTGSTIKPLEHMTESSRLELLYEVAPGLKLRNQAKLQTQKRQYRRKLKKAIDSEKKSQNFAAASFMENILNSVEFVDYDRIQDFGKLPMKRRDQRIKMLATYLNAHNQLRNKPNANNTFIQEGIIKVPHQWQVGTDIISLEDYIMFTRQFLEYHFPDYPIKLIVGHDDERSTDSNTGAHTHYFISARNRNTGEYDLRKAQINVVNEYIRQRSLDEKLLPHDGKMTRVQAKEFGHYYQCLARDFANEYLFKQHSLKAEFAPDSEKKSARRKKMNAEANLPKSERSHNYYTHQLELIHQKVLDAEEQYSELISQNNFLFEQEQQLLDAVSTIQVELSDLNDSQESIKSEHSQLSAESQRLRDENIAAMYLLDESKHQLAEMERQSKAVNDSTAAKLSQAIRQAYVDSQYRSRGLQHDPDPYFQNLVVLLERELKINLSKALNPALELLDDLPVINNAPTQGGNYEF